MARFGAIEGTPTVSGNRVHASVRVSDDLEQEVNLVVPFGITYDIGDLNGAPVMLLETANNDSAGLVLQYMNASQTGEPAALESDVQGVIDAITNGVPVAMDGGAALQTSIVAGLAGFPVGSDPAKVT